MISVWEELEPRPCFFRAATPPAIPPPAAAEAGGLESLPAQEEQAVGQGAAAAQGSRQRRPKSEKLVGMARVVVVAVALTGLFYSCVGEWLLAGRARFGLLRVPAMQQGRHVAPLAFRLCMWRNPLPSTCACTAPLDMPLVAE